MTAFVAGFSEVKLKLPAGIPLASGSIIAESANDDLYARAMIVQHDDYAAAILSCDLLGVPGRFVTEVRNIVYSATKCKLEELAIMITATHTHHGPALPNLSTSVPVIESRSRGIKYDDEALTRQLGEQLAATVIHAWNNRGPASFKIGTALVPSTTMHNRRTWDTYAGEPDLEILTLEVTREEGQSWVIYNIGTHPLGSLGRNTYNADIFGLVAGEMKQRCGSKTIVLPLIGAAGNVNPGSFQAFSEKRAMYIPESLPTIVHDICDGIENGVKNGTKITGDALQVVVKLVSIPVAEPDFANNFPFLRIMGNDPNFTLDTQVQVIQIGNIAIVGLPGEPMAIIGRRIKELGVKLGFQKVLVTSLANDFIGYYFPPESYDAGGYETHFCVHRNAGNIIMDGVEQVLEKVRNLDD
jgi:neutral ceramidase